MPATDASRERLYDLLKEAKLLAQEYYELTAKPLGITGEVAEYEAARILPGVELSPPRQTGYDATRRVGRRRQKLQIKGRCYPAGDRRSQRISKIRLDKDWDYVLLVLLDEHFEATAIYEAERPAVSAALLAPGSKARNERGQLSVSKFKAIGRRVWPAAS
jgi:hypothetical protein